MNGLKQINKQINISQFHVASLARTVYNVPFCSEVHIRRALKIAESDCWLRHVCLSVCSSACNTSAPTGRIFMQYFV